MLTIAWDVDDVLNGFMNAWLENWWNPKNADRAFNYEDLTENPPHRLLGIELTDYLKSLDEYRLSGHYDRLQPNEEILEWFKKHGHHYRHMALTAVPRIAASISASWVFQHFGDWIRTFHFVPSSRPDDIPVPYEPTKGAYLKRLNRVDIFIDDQDRNVHDVKSKNIRCFTASRPWSSSGMAIKEILEHLSLNKNNLLMV